MVGDANQILSLIILTTVGFVTGFYVDVDTQGVADVTPTPDRALPALLDEIHENRSSDELPVTAHFSSVPQILYLTDPVDLQGMVVLDANPAALSILGLDEDALGQRATAVFPVLSQPAAQPYLRTYQNVGWGVAKSGVHVGRVALGTETMERAWWFDLSILPTAVKGQAVAEFRPTAPVDCDQLRERSTDDLVTARCDPTHLMAVHVEDYRNTVYTLARSMRARIDAEARAPHE